MFNSLHSHVQSLFFTTKHNVLKRCFQILMWRGVLFFSSLLWRCGLVLASRLGDPGLFNFREKLKQLQLDVVMQSSRRTQRLGTGEPVNITFQLTSTWIACL